MTCILDRFTGQGTVNEHYLAVDMGDAASFMVQRLDISKRHLSVKPVEKGCDYNRASSASLSLHKLHGRKAAHPPFKAERFSLPEHHALTMNPVYTLLTSEVEYRNACDLVLARAVHQVLIFDRDLVALRLDEQARLEALASFLRMGGPRRIRIVLHDPGPLERNTTRLMQLIARYSHLVEMRQSPDDLRHLADTHVLADEGHGVRRFHVDQPRSALVLDDPISIHPWRKRFEEIWKLSRPCLRINTTGL